MAFVKLDVEILDSSVWLDRDARDILITSLLKAEPLEVTEPMEELKTRSLEPTGWKVPPGWYGFVPASSLGLLRAAVIDKEAGLEALERLASTERESRSKANGGRRMVRVDGGFIILNYNNFQTKDHKAAERMRRYRARLKARRDVTETPRTRNVTHSDADADADSEGTSQESSTPEETPSIHGVGSGEGENEGERRTPSSSRNTIRYIQVFNLVTGRRVKPNSEVRKKYQRARKAGYTDEELLVLPIIHTALNVHRRESRKLEPDWLLRDGSTGTHNWIGEALRMADQTKISGILAEQAKSLGLAGTLRELGAKVEIEEESQDAE